MPAPDIDLTAAHNPIVAGLAGALIGLRFAPGESWWQRAANVGAGSLLAAYLGPAVSDLLGQTGANAQAAIGFGLGLFGLSLASSLARAAGELPMAEIIRGWISRR